MKNEVEFNDLIFKALDHAVNSISDGEALIPFVMTTSKINRFVTDRIEDGKIRAEEYVRNEKDESLIAIAYDGILTVDDNKSDALFVEGINRNEKKN
jgi:hypothetical protein